MCVCVCVPPVGVVVPLELTHESLSNCPSLFPSAVIFFFARVWLFCWFFYRCWRGWGGSVSTRPPRTGPRPRPSPSAWAPSSPTSPTAGAPAGPPCGGPSPFPQHTATHDQHLAPNPLTSPDLTASFSRDGSSGTFRSPDPHDNPSPSTPPPVDTAEELLTADGSITRATARGVEGPATPINQEKVLGGQWGGGGAVDPPPVGVHGGPGPRTGTDCASCSSGS